MPFISSFDAISIVVPEPRISLWIPSSTAEVATVNSYGTNKLLAKGVSTFINGRPTFINGPKSPSDCIILES